MEKILQQILDKINKLEEGQGMIHSTLKEHGQRLKNLEIDVKGIKNEHGQKLKNLEIDVKGIKNEYGQKLGTLELDVKGIKEEHGQILRAILESKEIQRAEIDVLTHRTAKIEGTIKGAAEQVLKDLKEVSIR